MRDPVGSLVPGTAIDVFVGNQFRDLGNLGRPVGEVYEPGSELHYRYRRDDQWTSWQQEQLWFSGYRGQTNGECDTTGICVSITKDHGLCAMGDPGSPATQDSEYYLATIPAGTFKAGDAVEYCICVEYDGGTHATTWVRASADGSCTTASKEDALAHPFIFTVEPSSQKGQWDEVFDLPNTAVHAHVLPTGRVLIWGRRDRVTQTINTHECTPFVWDPANPGTHVPTPQPTLGDGKTKVNMFCSGHTFLPDGRLLDVGGHLFDGEGIQQSNVYDPVANTWTPGSLMNDGRWYPTATSLPDGDVLVLSGAVAEEHSMNAIPQVWRHGTWININGPGGLALEQIQSLELYPRIHVLSSGLLCMTGSLRATWLLDISKANGTWTRIAGEGREEGRRDYCPSVMYDTDKIIYIGGGNAVPAEGFVPTAKAEMIDLRATDPRWKPAGDMHFPRRQHNATILPDGTVLVTGGSRGGGGPGNGFNDLTRGMPVHVAELWDPKTGAWTELAAEQVDRCYHATAVLLPDATVLSAGSGEYAPWPKSAEDNFPEDNHRDGQIFSPPYLFKGPRPEITGAPESLTYGETFTIQTPQAEHIEKVSLVRLSSVTHSFNMNQHIIFPHCKQVGGELVVTSPVSRNVCVPGHYMLFILTAQGVPSVAKIIQMRPSLGPSDGVVTAAMSLAGAEVLSASPPAEDATFMTSVAHREALQATATGTRVVVGLTGRCPYGIGACWGGAEEALRGLPGVRYVDPIPDVANSTASVYLEDDGLPALARWGVEFAEIANGSYDLRGVEVSLEGTIETRDGELFLASEHHPVRLAALAPAEKVQWDIPAGAPQALATHEACAYDELAAEGRVANATQATVTGSLEQDADGYVLHVREFSV
jgi:hypothetical protein